MPFSKQEIIDSVTQRLSQPKKVAKTNLFLSQKIFSGSGTVETGGEGRKISDSRIEKEGDPVVRQFLRKFQLL